MTGALRLVVFDMDGTLIDSQDHIHGAMTLAFDAVGHDLPPRDKILSSVGLSLPEAMAVLVPDLSNTERAALVEAYKSSFGQMRADTHAPLFAGATSALDALYAADNVLLGVATGKSRRGLVHALGAHNIGHYFVTSQVADDHPSKPHPSMLQAALSETGVDHTCAVMIGDTTYDIEMGRATGFRTVGVGWGYHDAGDLISAGADIVIDDFAALAPALDLIWGQG